MGVARDQDAYVEQLRSLFPRGKAWPEARGPVWEQLLRSLSVELQRVDERLLTLIEEADPRTTVEMLEDYERELGLPDPCFGFGQSFEDRRRLVIAILLMQGGQSAAYYESLAALFGRPATVSEEFGFAIDEMGVGDGLAEEWSYFDVAESRVGDLLGEPAAPFAWWIASEATEAMLFNVEDSSVGDHLTDFGDRLLECLIARFKPAHTIAHHTYDATAAVAAA